MNTGGSERKIPHLYIQVITRASVLLGHYTVNNYEMFLVKKKNRSAAVIFFTHNNQRLS